MIALHLTEENVEDLIQRAGGKTKRELEEVLASVAPKKPFSPSVRKRPMPKAKPPQEALRSRVSNKDKTSEEDARPAPGATHVPDLLEPATEDRYNFRFSAGKEFTEKFERLAEVLGIENARSHLEEIFEKALDLALEKKDPKRKLERRRKREAKKKNSSLGKPGAEKSERKKAEKQAKPAPSRYIPSEIREGGSKGLVMSFGQPIVIVISSQEPLSLT